ncbi:MAG: DUF1207 domain-containing protein [Gemmatimonadales bacterium]|nr:DUF1207 domain-containing protein [Gemmatimonadales bacterium]MYK00551.1 DUF1207 domain-containing protein [Candidatus Palauibacter ramosifaciens]
MDGVRAVRVRAGRACGLMVCLLLLTAFAAATDPLVAQASDAAASGIRDPNGHPFRTPAGSPLEPVHRLALLSATRDSLRDGIALADVGDRLGFWIRRDPDGKAEYAGAIHGGAFSRFDLGGPDQALIEVHYRIGVLFRARYGAVAARAELYHLSSHLGDEFLLDTGARPISTSREGLELMLQGSPVSGLTVYGGPGVLLRSTPDFGRLSLRAGTAWESAPGARARFHASLDYFGWAELGWEPAITAEVGAGLARGTRIGLLLGFGPSRAEQFLRQSERLIGLSVSHVR